MITIYSLDFKKVFSIEYKKGWSDSITQLYPEGFLCVLSFNYIGYCKNGNWVARYSSMTKSWYRDFHGVMIKSNKKEVNKLIRDLLKDIKFQSDLRNMINV